MDKINAMVVSYRWFRVCEYSGTEGWKPCNRLIPISSIERIESAGTGAGASPSSVGKYNLFIVSQNVRYHVLYDVSSADISAAEIALINLIDEVAGRLDAR